MAKGILVHRADSIYDDFPEDRYQFPKRYLKRIELMVGDWILYYEPRGGGGRMGYNAVAQLETIVPDPSEPDMFLAIIKAGTYLPLEKFVPYKAQDGYLESELRKADGSLNGGKIQWAVRPISDQDFHRILARGMEVQESPLPRVDTAATSKSEISEEAAEFHPEIERTRVDRVINRAVRDRVFRGTVIAAYNQRCALTGLRMINGGGRAEVEAAHIRPVSENGPDTVRNGIALSGTAHWMFDRGLVSLADNYEVVVSRHVNNRDEVERLLHPSGVALVPDDPSLRPHPVYLDWHRTNCFKH